MSDTMILMGALVFYLISFILLIVFSFKTHKDLLWLMGIALFIFGSLVLGDPYLTSFFAISFSVVLLIIFCYKRDVLYAATTVLTILAAVTGSVLEDGWYYTLAPIIVVALIGKHLPQKVSKEI